MRLIKLLEEASGTFGMAGGQAIDLAAQGKQLDIAQVEEMHARKTGALIRASVLMAASCLPSLESHLYDALAAFVSPIGLAFQIQDDLLDVLGDVATLGKATGADGQRGKPTHPAVIGVEASQERVRLLHAQALEALEPFGARADAAALAGGLAPRAQLLIGRTAAALLGTAGQTQLLRSPRAPPALDAGAQSAQIEPGSGQTRLARARAR